MFKEPHIEHVEERKITPVVLGHLENLTWLKVRITPLAHGYLINPTSNWILKTPQSSNCKNN